MPRLKKPHIEPGRLGKNPFLVNLTVELHKLEIKGQWVSEDGMLLPADMEVERVPYAKLFADAERRKCMIGMKPRTKELLLWILYELEAGADYLWLNKKRFMKEAGIATYNTYNQAVNELIQNNFICKVATPANVFWINPHYFFCGSRGRKFPDKIIRK